MLVDTVAERALAQAVLIKKKAAPRIFVTWKSQKVTKEMVDCSVIVCIAVVYFVAQDKTERFNCTYGGYNSYNS